MSYKTDDVNVQIITKNTCSFDSIFNFFAVCCIDNVYIKRTFEKSKSEFAVLIQQILSSADLSQMLSLRNNILADIFAYKLKRTKKKLIYDCEDAIANVYMRMCDEYKILNSCKLIKSCEHCCTITQERDLPFLSTDLDVGKNIDFSNIDKYINDYEYSDVKCIKCGNFIKHSRQYNDFLALDIEATKNATKEIKINEMSQELILHGNTYHLKGIIEYRCSHFVTHIKRSDWVQYCDIRGIYSTPDELIFPAMLFYVKEQDQRK